MDKKAEKKKALSSSTSTSSTDKSENELENALNRLDEERISFIHQIQDLQQQLAEINLVLKAFDDVPDDRRCYRMVGGVLVERNVKQVRPSLLLFKYKITESTDKLQKDLDRANEERDAIRKQINELAGDEGSSSGNRYGRSASSATKSNSSSSSSGSSSKNSGGAASGSSGGSTCISSNDSSGSSSGDGESNSASRGFISNADDNSSNTADFESSDGKRKEAVGILV